MLSSELVRRLPSGRVASGPAAPARRVILLGASNVTLSFASLVETVRRMRGEPVEILAAMGLGRSFGQESTVLGRKISGIFSCALWQDLGSRPALPTTALVTDVGNDLLYGVTPDRLLQWIGGCLDRLAEAGAATVITQLPLESLDRLGEARFRLFRSLLFPRSRLTLSAARASAATVNEGLVELGRARKMPVIPVSGAWYGFDPIHLRRRVRRAAWSHLLSHWRLCEVTASDWRLGLRDRARLALLPPRERWILGWNQRSHQPSGHLRDGTTISLY
jgi:hypothetical protein